MLSGDTVVIDLHVQQKPALMEQPMVLLFESKHFASPIVSRIYLRTLKKMLWLTRLGLKAL
jgi:hypothetical protein